MENITSNEIVKNDNIFYKIDRKVDHIADGNDVVRILDLRKRNL